MGTVLELRPRVAHDWTLFERSQLETLLDRLPAQIGCDLAFGVTDAGDPWCAVLDPDGDVVLHIARIGGRFFVHAMGDNLVAETPDLPAAVAHFSDRDLASRRPAIVAQLFPSGAQPLPAHVFGALGEAQVLPMGGRIPEAAQAASTPPAMQGAPDMAAAGNLPANGLSADHFAWDAPALDLTAAPLTAANPSEPVLSDTPRSSLMINQTSPSEAVSELPVTALAMILPSGSPAPATAAPTAPFAAAANHSGDPWIDTGAAGPDPLPPQGGRSDFPLGSGISTSGRPAADNDMGVFGLTSPGGLFRAAAQEEQVDQTSTLLFVDFESPGVATQYWPPVGPLVGLSNYSETI